MLLGWLWAVLAGPGRARLVSHWRSHAGAAAGKSPTAGIVPYPTAHAVQFYLALVIFYLAVGSPLDQVGERFLFSAHMFQHQLLIYPAAILFLRGLPSWMIDPLLSVAVLRVPLRIFTHPVVAAATLAIVLGVWHAPGLYELALRQKLVHVTEHLMFFGAALVYWWPLFSPSTLWPRLRHGPQMLYLLGATIAMTPVFAYITFSHDTLYATYEYAPRLFPTFSAAEDQLLAGVSMQLVGVVVSMTVFGFAFYRWYQMSQRGYRRQGRS